MRIPTKPGRLRFKAMVVGVTACAATLLAPATAHAGLVRSDLVTFKLVVAPGGLTVTGCNIQSNSESLHEPAEKCTMAMNGFPSGSADLRVAGDPTEEMQFNYTVGTDNRIRGNGIEVDTGAENPCRIVGVLKPAVTPNTYHGKIEVLESVTGP